MGKWGEREDEKEERMRRKRGWEGREDEERRCTFRKLKRERGKYFFWKLYFIFSRREREEKYCSSIFPFLLTHSFRSSSLFLSMQFQWFSSFLERNPESAIIQLFSPLSLSHFPDIRRQTTIYFVLLHFSPPCYFFLLHFSGKREKDLNLWFDHTDLKLTRKLSEQRIVRTRKLRERKLSEENYAEQEMTNQGPKWHREEIFPNGNWIHDPKNKWSREREKWKLKRKENQWPECLWYKYNEEHSKKRTETKYWK